MTQQPLNQILYGPPGTGKTYNTVIKAMEILGSQTVNMKDNKGNFKTNYSPDEYKELKKEFDNYKNEGRIEFITFHQSYSYEEFVEGIKPELNSDNVIYQLKDGTFKRICEHADTKFSDNFEEIYTKFLDEIDGEKELFKLTTSKHKKEFGLEINSNNNLNLYTGNDFHKQGTLTKDNIQKHFLQTRTQKDWSSYYDGIIDYLKEKYNLKKQDKAVQKHVLIIDEINRGNISKIFGELITLIEEDKRECIDGINPEKYNTMTVILPYSGDTFSVPNNLYIIGTMNTSDRSIASVDIALRRRFKFVEMMPNDDAFDDFPIAEKLTLKNIFKTLNQRICALLDCDHQIGHSYFIGVDSIDKLKDVWFDSVMPLLNEYFYGDWEKLQAILGISDNKKSSFIQEISTTNIFAKGVNNVCDESVYYEFRDKKIFYENSNNREFLQALGNAFATKEESKKETYEDLGNEDLDEEDL